MKKRAKLFESQELFDDDKLTSPNLKYFARMQKDGNFVIQNNDATLSPTWASSSGMSRTANSRFKIETLGTSKRLALYHPTTKDRYGNPLMVHDLSGWIPNLEDGTYVLMQDDGNVKWYTNKSVTIWERLWPQPPPASGSPDTLTQGNTLKKGWKLTSLDGGHTAELQTDGNFVVYKTSPRQAIWASGTSGSNIEFKFYILNATGLIYLDNLVTTDIHVIADTTRLVSGSKVVMQTDGNLVWYNGGNNGGALWASKG
jgi:hypothetical protein